MKTEKKKDKDKAHVFRNTAFMLSCGFKAAPLSLLTVYFSYIAENVYYSVVVNVMFLRSAMSVIEGHGTFKDLVKTVLLIVAGKLLIDLLHYFVDYYVRIRFEIKCESYINALIFKKAQEVELACYETPDFFDKYNRATWVISKDGFKRIIEGSAWVIGSIVSFVSLISYLISIDPLMLVFIVCPIFVMAFRILRNKEEFKMEKDMTPYERRKEYVRRTVLLKDFAKDIKTTGIFEVLKRCFSEAIDKNIEIIKKYGIRIAILEIVSDFFGDVVPVAGGFGYAGYRLLVLGNIQIADFSVLLSAISQCRNKLNNFSYYFSNQQKYCLWVQSMREFLAFEPTIKGGEQIPGSFESLELKNVSFRYGENGSDILKNISFKINKGETVAVVGHNGAGKTTLSKLLMRLYDVTEGEILYNGVNIKEYDLEKYRDKFASVFQDYKIFAMTVAENVLVCETDEENLPLAEKALIKGGVSDKINTLPHGMNTVLTREFDDGGALLSGGETQKLAVARLFAKNFDIAVLDEPSSALDPVAESKMYDSLLEGTQDKAVIYISHRLSCAVNADKIYVFHDGRITESGTHDELMNAGGEYCAMFTVQASGYREEAMANE